MLYRLYDIPPEVEDDTLLSPEEWTLFMEGTAWSEMKEWLRDMNQTYISKVVDRDADIEDIRYYQGAINMIELLLHFPQEMLESAIQDLDTKEVQEDGSNF